MRRRKNLFAAGKFIPALLLVLALALLSGAPGTRAGEPGRENPPPVSGFVVDSAGRPLAGIAVKLEKNGAATTITGTDGRFAVENAPSGWNRRLFLAGDRGVGQVRLEKDAAEPRFTYPVTTTVVILHDNDLHFSFNLPVEFKRAIADIRARHENVFLLSGGDVFNLQEAGGAGKTSALYERRGRFMIEAMNELGYNAMVLGNHDTYPVGDATGLNLALANFPLLGANLVPGPEPAGLPETKPFVVLETANGLTVAVLGLGRARGRGMRMLDTRETVEKYLHLGEEHDLLVALSHLGLGEDRQLAERFSRLDAIIGGHSHTLLATAETVNGVLIAQAGGHLHFEHQSPGGSRIKYLGQVVLVLVNGVVTEKSGRVIVLRQG